MREIKFRAWEHNLEEMILVDDIQFYRGDDIDFDGIVLKLKPRGEQPIMINTRSAWRIADGEDITLMQYTGLKDKNGKEIYENDHLFIVEDVYVEMIGGHARTEPEGMTKTVKWKDGAFWWGDELLSEYAQYGEVIGNYYEGDIW